MDNLIDVISKIGTPFIIGIAAVFLAFTIKRYLDIFAMRSGRISDIRFELDQKLDSIRTESESAKLTKAIEDKKDKLLNLPTVSFHFADKERIRDFYNDYFREPTVESMVKELANEVSGDIKGSLPKILESKVGGKNLTKWISTSKLPEISLNGMFLRYQRETIKNQQVTLDIELVDVELNQLEEFQEHIIQLRDEYGFELSKDKIEKHSIILKEKAAEKTLIKLEKTSGWVIVEGSFLILEESTEFYKCILRHPVSSWTKPLRGRKKIKNSV